VDQYVDVIAMRHPQIGSARIAAEAAEAPVLNGGDGAGQHPTQALLDVFTIQSERGQVDGNTIALCGDLKYGRTVHAGVELYKHYDCKLIFVAPEALKMPPDVCRVSTRLAPTWTTWPARPTFARRGTECSPAWR
jgi:aspartate carbamoyltransferase catalytic subunit